MIGFGELGFVNRSKVEFVTKTPNHTVKLYTNTAIIRVYTKGYTYCDSVFEVCRAVINDTFTDADMDPEEYGVESIEYIKKF